MLKEQKKQQRRKETKYTESMEYEDSFETYIHGFREGSPVKTEIGEQQMHDIASGAAILGTGGGGDPYIGKLMAITAIKKYGPLILVDPNDVPDDWFVIPTAMMGAPTVLIERIPRGDEAFSSLKTLEKYLGKKANATMPIEAGGVNSTIPFVVAAHAGIPVVDADGMGRAFPELQMETFSIYGIRGSPIAIRDERGNSAILETIDNYFLEWLARGLTIRLGGSAHIAEYTMTGKEMKATSVHNSVSLALKIGKTIREAIERKEPPLEALIKVTEGTNYGKAIPLFTGKIIDVERRTTSGFAVGSTTIEGINEYSGKTMRIRFQNENLMASVDGNIVATVPDLISILDMETAQAITTENLRYGYRVTVVGIPTPEIMRTEKALKVWGPRYFKLDTDYVPLELRHREYYREAKLSPEKEKKYREMLKE
jgi:DUF917 family protein